MKKIFKRIKDLFSKKRRFDLYVHGNLTSWGYCSSWSKPAKVEEHVPYESVDLKHGIIIEGDMEVDNIYVIGKKVGASGFISGRGVITGGKLVCARKSLYTDGFESARGKN